jgi:hypothetical protein
MQFQVHPQGPDAGDLVTTWDTSFLRAFDPGQERDDRGRWTKGEEEWEEKGEEAWKRHRYSKTEGWSRDDLSRIDRLSRDRGAHRDYGLEEIVHAQGFDTAPDKGDVRATVAAGGTEVFRGIHGDHAWKYAHDYTTGDDKRQGYGMSGNGNYFTTSSREADNFAGGAMSGAVIHGALKPGARIADEDTVGPQWHAERRDMEPDDVGFWATSDLGRWAAINGYDAIGIFPASKDPPSGWEHFVVLNRGALVVEPV